MSPRFAALFLKQTTKFAGAEANVFGRNFMSLLRTGRNTSSMRSLGWLAAPQFRRAQKINRLRLWRSFAVSDTTGSSEDQNEPYPFTALKPRLDKCSKTIQSIRRSFQLSTGRCLVFMPKPWAPLE